MDISVPETVLSRQYGAMQAAFEQALERNRDRCSESFYTFAGKHVRLRIVGHEMAQHIVQPFSHLRADTSLGLRPELTIDLWDENRTDIRREFGSPRLNGGWFQVTATSPKGGFLAQQLPNTLSYLDLTNGHLVGSIAWNEQMFIYERAKPLARPLLEWHNHQDVQMIHAGLVSQRGQGILFAGRSGSGKSTAALACSRAGFSFLSEDYVGLQHLQAGSFVGHSVYCSLFLDTGHLQRFPDLASQAIKGRLPHEKKSVIILSQICSAQLQRVTPIRILALCRVVDAPESRIRPASKGEALLALGLSTLLQIPSPGRQGFDKLGQLVEQMPCYCLELGRDLESIPQRVEELLVREGEP